MKYYYIIDIKENEKHYAYIAIVNNGTNLKHCQHFTQDNIYSITPCSTKKQARIIVEEWNRMYKSEGKFLFDDGPQF